jgi:hypothetical protein
MRFNDFSSIIQKKVWTELEYFTQSNPDPIQNGLNMSTFRRNALVLGLAHTIPCFTAIGQIKFWEPSQWLSGKSYLIQYVGKDTVSWIWDETL